MKKKDIKDIEKRIEYIKTELAHERYHDGWVVEGLKKELKELEKKIDNLDEDGRGIGQYIGLNRNKNDE